jgi:hypothetical protein
MEYRIYRPACPADDRMRLPGLSQKWRTALAIQAACWKTTHRLVPG